MRYGLGIALVFMVIDGWAAAPPLHTCDVGGFVRNNIAGCTLTATTAGNLVVAVLYVQSSTVTVTSITDGGGGNTWHIIGPVAGTGNESFIGWTVVTNSFSSWQWNLSTLDGGDGGAAEYSNMASAGTVADCDSSGAGGGSGNGTALTSGSCTPSAANDLLVGIGGVMSNSATMTAGGSYTLIISQAHSTQGNSYGWEDENSSSCASQNATATESVSAQWSMIMAAFKTSAPTGCGGGGFNKLQRMERYE